MTWDAFADPAEDALEIFEALFVAVGLPAVVMGLAALWLLRRDRRRKKERA